MRPLAVAHFREPLAMTTSAPPSVNWRATTPQLRAAFAEAGIIPSRTMNAKQSKATRRRTDITKSVAAVAFECARRDSARRRHHYSVRRAQQHAAPRATDHLVRSPSTVAQRAWTRSRNASTAARDLSGSSRCGMWLDSSRQKPLGLGMPLRISPTKARSRLVVTATNEERRNIDLAEGIGDVLSPRISSRHTWRR
jgi:hypothetical protein